MVSVKYETLPNVIDSKVTLLMSAPWSEENAEAICAKLKARGVMAARIVSKLRECGLFLI